MDILTPEDINAIIDEAILEEVTDGDETILDTAELDALGEMTGYLNIRYDATKCFDVTLTDDYNGIKTVIQRLVDIMLYHAHSRVMPDNVPELREKRYNNAINWLEKVASGYIDPALPLKEEDPTNPLRYGNSSTPENKYY
jgi:phage gp36-like protein